MPAAKLALGLHLLVEGSRGDGVICHGRAKAIADAVAAGFEARFGRRCPIFATRAAQGASAVE